MEVLQNPTVFIFSINLEVLKALPPQFDQDLFDCHPSYEHTCVHLCCPTCYAEYTSTESYYQ